MKYSTLLPFAALATAFVIPDDEVMSQVAIESDRSAKPVQDRLPSSSDVHNVISEVGNTFNDLLDSSKNAFDDVLDNVEAAAQKTRKSCHGAAFNAKSWLDSKSADVEQKLKDVESMKHGHHHKPNKTVYELISGSKYTTKLAALINEYEDLVKLLNGTAANYTVFAPIDKAFEKIPDDAPKPSKEQLKNVLLYHTSADFYPAGRVLVTHTIPTLLDGEHIGGKPQRLSTNIGIKGLTVNFYSRIIAIDIFGTNGVIHGVDSLLIPPPKAAEVIQLLPGEFSTLELGLEKTGLFKAINDTSTHNGGTIFAPSNFAFQKLGPKINAFLFSKYGLKYLKALLEYHVVQDQTLYSDAFYKAESKGVKDASIPKGFFHVDLQTLLEDKSLSIDVARYGRLISIKINAFSTVTIEDGIVADGVIQVVSNVLIPPKKVEGVEKKWEGEDLEVEDLIERLGPFTETESDTYEL
ncbi:uncharacterized protein KY384_006380 [Bacidia gigantensis]|uniref:uncharacterized protein n=1 Tax=Bacidia gigantensis TaxID=2732470 RepID=UPI001D05099F|nr:uncharacterized protein KY384_006380 [Bacidia gigantensis]KAG8528693.1 hypothetical protein KY384_006380 [Bacidia gigantensis]